MEVSRVQLNSRLHVIISKKKSDDHRYCGRGSIWHTYSQSKSCYIGSRNPTQNRLITHATDLVQLRDHSLMITTEKLAMIFKEFPPCSRSVGRCLIAHCSGKAHRTSTRRNWAGRRDSYSVLVSSYSYYSHRPIRFSPTPLWPASNQGAPRTYADTLALVN
jgi:hypothetical protein